MKKRIWLEIQVIWDMKWDLIKFFVCTLIVLSGLFVIIMSVIEFANFINHIFTNPETIGKFFGKIVSGYKSIN